MFYQDGLGGSTMMKRFYVNSITRDTEYDLTRGAKGSKMLYFSVHPNGEREVVTVLLRPRPHLKRLRFDVDLGELLIKGRNSAGNRVTKEIIQKIIQKEVGGSTLAARKIWYDDVVGRLNDEGRGRFLGDFKGDDRILTLYRNGEYRLSSFDLSNHFDEDMVHLEKWNPHRPISCVYFDAEKEINFVKRFACEVMSDKRVSFISESEGSYLQVVSTAYRPEIRIVFNKQLKETKNLPDQVLNLADLIDVKGMKAQGNQVTKMKVKEILLTHEIAEGKEPWPADEVPFEVEGNVSIDEDGEASDVATDGSIEWDLTKKDEDDQPTLFD
jgi:topoisomerase-4 subunit A